MARLWSMILAGGEGRRLRAATRALGETSVPKQFCHFGASRSLVQATFERIRPLVPGSRCLIVVDRMWADRAAAQLPEVRRVVAQPRDRGTAAGILLPLMHLMEQDSEAHVVILPSDHSIADGTLFRACVGHVEEEVAHGRAGIVLLGSPANSPRADYGWIRAGASVTPDLREVAEFCEKPPAPEAERLRLSGALWNTMIVVARAAALLEMYESLEPRLYEELRLCMAPPPHERGKVLRQRYATLPHRDFSRDLLAQARGLTVYTLPEGLRWCDIGTPDRLSTWLSDQGRSDLATLVP